MFARQPPTLAALPPWLLYPPRFGHCLALAVLLHILLVLVLGSAPGGTARPGEGLMGRLNVTLRGLPQDAQAPEGEPEPPRSMGPVGQATAPRYGGRVQAQATTSSSQEDAGAAELGRYSETAQLKSLGSGPPQSGQVQRLAPVPLAGPAPSTQPMLNEPLPPTPTPSPAPTPARLSTLSAPQAPRPQPSHLAPLTAAPTLTQEVSAALPPTPIRTATLQAPTTVLTRPVTTPAIAPAASFDAPSALAEPLPPAPVRTSTLPAPSTAPLVRAGPSPIPLARAPTLTPNVGTEPLPPAPTLAPSPVPSSAATAAASTTDAAPHPATSSPTSSPPAASTSAAVAGAAQSRAIGGPDAGDRVGHDIATAPATAASAPPPLNLSLPSTMHGGELASRRFGGLIPLLPQPAERKSKLEREMDAAGNPDCRKAYADAGVLAVVPLAIDTAKGKGCQW